MHKWEIALSHPFLTKVGRNHVLALFAFSKILSELIKNTLRVCGGDERPENLIRRKNFEV